VNPRKDRTGYGGPSMAEIRAKRKAATVKWINSLRRNHR